MKISRKLGLLSLLIISSILALIVFSYVKISSLSKDISKNRNISTPFMIESMNFQQDIVQIQQWLTDISATRAKPGFDDGFDEAKVYYEDAHAIIDRLNNYEVDEEFLVELKSSLDEYYSVGIDMANAYIQDGTEAGNTYMEKFDPFAEEMQQEVSELITTSTNNRELLSQDINSNILKLKYISILLSLIVLIVAILSFIIVKKSVLNRLNEFVTIFKDISEGDGDLTSNISETSSDELGQVTKYFNNFIKRIHDMIVLIKSMSYETNNSAQKTSVITNELTSSIGEVASTTESVAEQARLQTETVKRVINNVKQNNNQISIGVKNINESVELAETANELTEVGFHAMSKTVSSFEVIESDINTSKYEVNNLEKSVAEIGSAIDIITDISYQINLLSLNASIEAARAGEHGKGFSVVSSEIGSLAVETKQATEKISDLIEKIQHDTKKTVLSMELNSKNITSQKKILDQGSDSIKKTRKINALNSEKIHDVSSIFSDIDKNLDELTELCEYMLSGADSTQASSEEVAASIEEQLSALEEVSSQMNTMKSNSSNLNLKLDEFII